MSSQMRLKLVPGVRRNIPGIGDEEWENLNGSRRSKIRGSVESSPAQARACKVPGHPLQIVLTTSFTLSGPAQPAIHRKGAMVELVQFTNYASAVVHQDPLLESHQLYPFAGQGSTDVPLSTIHTDVAHF
jgi:hypothetical protein